MLACRCVDSLLFRAPSYHAPVVAVWPFLLVAVPLVLSPGASTAVVLRNSLRGGVRAGFETAVGANVGSVCYGLLCAFGFAVALQQWPGAWVVLRAGGIAYLSWLGVQSLRRALRSSAPSARVQAPVREKPSISRLRNYRDGFVTNLSNPALATFYLVVLPQFIPRSTPVVRGALVLTAIHVSLAFSWHLVWASAGGRLARVLSDGWPRRALEGVTAVALLFLAFRMLR